jgi:YVTN family beta-propeller protein
MKASTHPRWLVAACVAGGVCTLIYVPPEALGQEKPKGSPGEILRPGGAGALGYAAISRGEPKSPALPSQTSSIALTPDEKTVCAVNRDSGSISLWDWSGTGAVREIKVGEEPRTVAVSAEGRKVYVVNQRSQTLTVVDIPAAKVVGTITSGGQPYGVVLIRNGQRAFVSQYAGGYVEGKYCAGLVSVVDLAAGQVATRIPVQARSWAMTLSGDERSLYLTHYLQLDGEGRVSEIDTASGRVRRVFSLKEDSDVSDGLVWDLTVEGDVPKVSNTMDLVLTPGTAPPFFHRGTPHFEPAEEQVVRVFAGGTGFLRERERGSGALV